MGKNTRPYLKKMTKNSKKGWRSAQVVEHLSSKCQALSSNPSTTKATTKGSVVLFSKE
jgi:hypothetical protein